MANINPLIPFDRGGDTRQNYLNLNLNKFSKFSSYADCVKSFSTVKAKSQPSYDHNIQNYQVSNFKSTCILYDKKDQENKKKWKKRDRNSSANNSTLSLHIAAYENDIEQCGYESTAKLSDENCKKFTRSFKYDIPHKNEITSLYEFPRQQENEPPNPLIMQYKSRQHLLNPNNLNESGLQRIKSKFFNNLLSVCDDDYARYSLSEVISNHLAKQTAFKVVFPASYTSEVLTRWSAFSAFDNYLHENETKYFHIETCGEEGWFMNHFNEEIATPQIINFTQSTTETVRIKDFTELIERDYLQQQCSDDNRSQWHAVRLFHSFFKYLDDNKSNIKRDWNFSHVDEQFGSESRTVLRSANAVIPLTFESGDMAKLSYLLPISSSKLWLFFTPDQQNLLNEHLIQIKQWSCISPTLHNLYLPSLNLLEELNIMPIYIMQNPGEMVAIASGTAYMAINLGPTVEEEVTVYSNRCLVNSIKRKICDCEAVNEMEKNVPEDMLAYRLHLEYSVLAGVYGPNIHPKEKVLQDAKPVLSASPQNGPNNLKMSSSKDGKRLSSLREEDSNISEEKKYNEIKRIKLTMAQNHEECDTPKNENFAEFEQDLTQQESIPKRVVYSTRRRKKINNILLNSKHSQVLKSSDDEQPSPSRVLTPQPEKNSSPKIFDDEQPSPSRILKQPEITPMCNEYEHKVLKILDKRLDNSNRYKSLTPDQISSKRELDAGRPRNMSDEIGIWFKKRIEACKQRIKRARKAIEHYIETNELHHTYGSKSDVDDRVVQDSQLLDVLKKRREIANILKQLYCADRPILSEAFNTGFHPEEIVKLFFCRKYASSRILFLKAVKCAKCDEQFYENLIQNEDAWNEYFGSSPQGIERVPWELWDLHHDELQWQAKVVIKKQDDGSVIFTPFEDNLSSEDDNVLNKRVNDFDNGGDSEINDRINDMDDVFYDTSQKNNNGVNEDAISSDKNDTILLSSDSDESVIRENKNLQILNLLKLVDHTNEHSFVESTLKAFDFSLGEDKPDARYGVPQLSRHILLCFRFGSMLNNHVMNEYCKLVETRSTECEWLPKCVIGQTHLSDNELSAVPKYLNFSGCKYFAAVILEMRHFILYISDLDEKTYFCYDPLVKAGLMNNELFKKRIENLKQLTGLMINGNEVKYDMPKNVVMPQQSNGIDCGVFVAQFLEQFMGGVTNIQISGIENTRKLMLCELLNSKLYHTRCRSNLAKKKLLDTQNSQSNQQQPPPQNVLIAGVNGIPQQHLAAAAPTSSINPPPATDEPVCVCKWQPQKPPVLKNINYFNETLGQNLKICNVYEYFETNQLRKFIEETYIKFRKTEPPLTPSISKYGVLRISRGELDALYTQCKMNQHLMSQYFGMIKQRGDKIGLKCFIGGPSWGTKVLADKEFVPTSLPKPVILNGINFLFAILQVDQTAPHYVMFVLNAINKNYYVYNPRGIDAYGVNLINHVAILQQVENVKKIIARQISNDLQMNFKWDGWTNVVPSGVTIPREVNSAIAVSQYAEQISRGIKHVNMQRITKRAAAMFAELANGELFFKEKCDW